MVFEPSVLFSPAAVWGEIDEMVRQFYHFIVNNANGSWVFPISLTKTLYLRNQIKICAFEVVLFVNNDPNFSVSH